MPVAPFSFRSGLLIAFPLSRGHFTGRVPAPHVVIHSDLSVICLPVACAGGAMGRQMFSRQPTVPFTTDGCCIRVVGARTPTARAFCLPSGIAG